MKNFLSIIVFVFALVSCAEDQIEKYTGPAAINLLIEVKSAQVNEAQVPLGFLAESVLDSTINLIANVQGTTASYNRTIKLRIPDTLVAKEGLNFSIAKEVVLPAGENSVKIPLTIKRDGLKSFTDGLKIVVAVEQSADFSPGVYTNVSITATDDMPTQWIGYTYWFPNRLGQCTKTKYRFVYKTLGFYDFTSIAYDYNALGVYKNYLNVKLDEYEAQHGVRLWDPDLNKNVTFP